MNHIFWTNNGEPMRDLEEIGGEPQTVDFYRLTRELHRTAERPTRDNRWRQDRVSMRTGESFSGFVSFFAEGVAVTSSAGLIRDRAQENLTGSDVGIARLYSRLKDLAHSQAAGEQPLGIKSPVGEGRAFQTELKPGVDWRSLSPEAMRPARPAAVS